MNWTNLIAIKKADTRFRTNIRGPFIHIYVVKDDKIKTWLQTKTTENHVAVCFQEKK